MVHPSIYSHCLTLFFPHSLLFFLIFLFHASLSYTLFLFCFPPSPVKTCECLNSLKMWKHVALFLSVILSSLNVLQCILRTCDRSQFYLHSEWQHQVGLNEQMQGHHRHKPHRQQPSAEHPVTAQHLHQPAQTPLQQHPLWVTLYAYPFTRNNEKRSSLELWITDCNHRAL